MDFADAVHLIFSPLEAIMRPVASSLADFLQLHPSFKYIFFYAVVPSFLTYIFTRQKDYPATKFRSPYFIFIMSFMQVSFFIEIDDGRMFRLDLGDFIYHYVAVTSFLVIYFLLLIFLSSRSRAK